MVLRRDGRTVGVEPQAFDLLCYLVERRGHVVLKDELLDNVWGDRFVSESALTTQIKSVRHAVGDDGSAQRVIRTVHGKGYEFIAEVVKMDDPTDDERPSAQETRSSLPAAVQPLVGRAALLEQLVHETSQHRLVTLVGTGGVGKTSVAFELARSIGANYRDGVYPVELVTVLDEGATFEAFATALDVNTRQRGSTQDAIIDMLGPRHMLLVLDNCEHLVEPVARLVHRIMREAPEVSILATSREPLAVTGEHVWTVEPLSVDGGANVASFDLASAPAVALFVERAKEADPRFTLDAATAPAVLEICRRLDGIPLAIELAAARTRAIDVTEIAARLDERFRLLKGVRRGADPRHRTLHDAISWSYDLLGGDEQRLFAALAVFAGQFDLDAAEAVCHDDDVLDLLTRLTERSMLAVRRPASGGTRYELLETLREYARRRLDDNQSVELFTTHARHFAMLARQVEDEVRTADEARGVTRADAGFADLRAAQRFALQIGDFDTAFGLIGSIREYAMRALRYEAFAWAGAAASIPDGSAHRLHPLMIAVQAYGAWVRGEYDTALQLAYAARGEEEAGGVEPCGLVERVLANVMWTVGRADDGMVEGARNIELAQESGDQSRLAHAYYMSSVSRSSIGEHDEGRALAVRAREAGAATGSPTDVASAWVADGFAAVSDEVAALEAFDTADRLARSAGNRWMSAFARTEASGLLVQRGDLVAGCAGLADMVDLWYRAGEWSQQWHTLSRCVIALDRIGQPEIAAEAVGAIEAHAILGAPPSMTTLRAIAFETRDSLPEKLGSARSDDLLAAGAARPLAEIVERTRNALLARAVG